MLHSNELQEAIIKKRLEVDERPLRRLAKTILHVSTQKPTSMQHADSMNALNEFDHFENTLKRLTLLSQANSKERERYDVERQIVHEAFLSATSEIRDLESRLALEKQERSNRSSYDVLAIEIEKEAPKSRKHQEAAIAQMKEEIDVLEQEQEEYRVVWHQRQDAFIDIMKKLTDMQRAISGEKEDAELRDVADSDDEGAVSVQGDIVESEFMPSSTSLNDVSTEDKKKQFNSDDQASIILTDHVNHVKDSSVPKSLWHENDPGE